MRLSKVYLIVTLVIVLSAALLPFAPGRVTAQGEPQVRVIPIIGQMPGVAISADGKTAVVYEIGVLHDNLLVPEYLPLRLIDLDSGTERLLIGHTDYATSAVFSPDGTVLASYHGGGEIILWDVAEASILKRIPALPGNVRLAFMPDGVTLAVQPSGTLPLILIWDTSTGHITAVLARRFTTLAEMMAQFDDGPPDSAVGLSVAPDGQQIAVPTLKDNILLFGVADGSITELVRSEEQKPHLSYRNGIVYASYRNGIVYAPDGSALAYSHQMNGTVYIVDAQTGDPLNVIETAPKSLPAIAPSLSRIAWMDDTQTQIVIWDAATPDAPTQVALPPIPAELQWRPQPQTSPRFSADGKRLVVGGFVNLDSGDNLILIVDLP